MVGVKAPALEYEEFQGLFHAPALLTGLQGEGAGGRGRRGSPWADRRREQTVNTPHRRYTPKHVPECQTNNNNSNNDDDEK